jgi:hypothetical protein
MPKTVAYWPSNSMVAVVACHLIGSLEGDGPIVDPWAEDSPVAQGAQTFR